MVITDKTCFWLFWGHFGLALGCFEAFFCLILGRFAVVLGLFWAVLERFRSFQIYSAPLQVILELF
jgi:hypothetical protein